MCLIRILGFSFALLFMGCAYADIHYRPNTFSKETKEKAGFSNQQHITLLNDNLMFYERHFNGFEEFAPLYGESPEVYFSQKQREILKARYKSEKIDIFNIHNKSFDPSQIKSDFVYLVSAEPIQDERYQTSLLKVLKILTFCMIPCTQKFKLDITVKAYHRNKWIAENKTTTEATQSVSPLYLIIPTSFEMLDSGKLTIEGSVQAKMYLVGFQNTMDDLIQKLSLEK
jgi:hypothetical protein